MSRPFQEYELEAFLGDYRDDFDVEAIIAEATYISGGNRFWRDLQPDEMNAICEMNERRGENDD